MESPPFEEALAAFRGFAESEGFSTNFIWIFHEDVLACRWDSCRWKYWVRVPSSSSNAELSQQYYEFGRKQGFGVTLELHYPLKGQSACSVWVPKDWEEACSTMQGPLKLHVPSQPVDAYPVYSDIAWRWRRFVNLWCPNIGFTDYWLPSHDEVARIVSPESYPQ